MSHKPGDTLTKKGAEQLAAKIRAYWQSVGKDIEVWIEPMERNIAKIGHCKNLYVVRSDLKI